MSENGKLMPVSLMTPEYLAWSAEHYNALLAQFNDPDDPAGAWAREMFDKLWPLIETLPYADGVEDARTNFAVTVQEFANNNVGLYRAVRRS